MSTPNNTAGANFAQVASKPAIEGDCIPDERMNEIVRRLEIQFMAKANSDIVATLAEPTDRTKIWWPISPVNGQRIGRPKVWSQDLLAWVEFGQVGKTVIPVRRRRNGLETVAAGGSVVPIEFQDIGTSNYMVYIAPLFQLAGVAIPAPGNMNNFAWAVVSRANAQVSVQLYAVPAGGMSILWEVAEMEGTTDAQGS